MFKGDERWRGLSVPAGETFAWDEKSTYVKNPPYFENMPAQPAAVRRHLRRSRALLPRQQRHHRSHFAGGIDQAEQPGGTVPHRSRSAAGGLQLLRIAPRQSRSHDARYLRQRAAAQQAGARIARAPSPSTCPIGEEMSIFDASEKYRAEGTPLIVLAGKEYGSGSSRDWAAKGPRLLGVRAVVAESFERIHRSNLVGMGILPLQFLDGRSRRNPRPYRRRDFRHHRPDRCAGKFRAGQDGEGARHQARRRCDWSSTPRCASTPRRKCCTTSTVAFCSTCCGGCWGKAASN